MMQIKVEMFWEEYVASLERRFKYWKKQNVVAEAAESLWDDFISYLHNNALEGEIMNKVSLEVDNYIINGEFISHEEYDANPDDWPEYESWDELVSNSMLHNKYYACRMC